MHARPHRAAHYLTVLAMIVGSLAAVGMGAAGATAPTTDRVVARAVGAPPVAELDVVQSPTYAGDTAVFGFSASSVDPAYRFARGTIDFGDGTSNAIGDLSDNVSHVYDRKGVFLVTFELTDSAGNEVSTDRTLVVSAADELTYKATTRSIAPSRLVGVRNTDATHVRLTFKPRTAPPRKGSTVMVASSSLFPQGVAVVVSKAVVKANKEVLVDGVNATLQDIYADLRVSTDTEVGDLVDMVNTRPGQPSSSRSVSAKAVPFSCSKSGGNERPISVSADFTRTVISPTIDLRAKTFQLVVIAKPVLTLGASFSGGAECSLGDYFALNIPIPAVPGLVVSISPYFKLSASGTISADFSWSPTFIMEVTRSPSRNANFLQLTSKASASASGSATLSLEGGVSVTVSVARAAGIQAELGPKISLRASVASDGSKCLTVESAIEATVKLFAKVLFVSADLVLYRGEYAKSTLFSACAPSGSSSSGGGGGAGGPSGSGSSSGSSSPGGGGQPPPPPGPTDVNVSNNNGELALRLTNFPLGTAYYFCHSGPSSAYPSGGTITNRGRFTLTSYSATFQSGLCAGSGNTWIGIQGPDGRDYFSNQTNLSHVDPAVSAGNNNGQLSLALANFPLGTTYFFCHAGSSAEYPSGGSITNRGQFTVTSGSASFASGLCAGSGNTWIGLQGADGRDYFSNQVELRHVQPGVVASNNNGQLSLKFENYPLGTTYFFCHSGNASDYPSGGVITNKGQINVTSSSQSWSSGLCSGRGNAWIGLQAPDGADYFSNQVNLVAAQTPGAGVTASNNNGQMAVQLRGYPLGTTYFFCHSGNASDYPSGGVITNKGQINVTSSSQSWSSGLCSGRGNAWIGLQAPDGADYFSNQVNLEAAPTPGASVTASSSGGRLTVQFTNYPTGTSYYFCHTGDSGSYPTGGSVPSRGQINVTSPNQTSGVLCSGSGNFWVGFQAPDGHDYYTNQVTL